MMMRPISVQLSSTIELDDVKGAFALLFQPHQWITGSSVSLLVDWFKKTYGVENAVPFNSGRSALYALLRALGIGKDDEVILQAFTCVVVPNAILWCEAKPVYADILSDGFTMSVDDLEKKITNKTKAIIVQHTFGYPDAIEKIAELAKKRGLFLIEDCAHSLGNDRNKKLLGTFGDAAFFSFGRDKVVSSIFGGMAITNDRVLGQKLKRFQSALSYPSHRWVMQQLLYPLFFAVILPLYSIGIGKFLIIVFQKLKMLSKPISYKEYRGQKPSFYPQKYPNALAHLILSQIKKLDYLQKRRKQAAQLYWKNLAEIPAIILPPKTNQALLRYPILVPDARALLQKAKIAGIILGDWYGNVIDPKGCDKKKARYEPALCPIAEKKAHAIVNLPTAPVLSKKEILEVIHFIKNFYDHH